MGKKSKKKTGKQHQERMKARAGKREEQIEEEQRVDSQFSSYVGKPREFLDGDYVRYYDGPPVKKRGIISKTINGKELPKGKFEFTSYNETIKEIVNVTDLYPDMYGTQLRFREGRIVSCRSEEYTDNEWTKCEVKQLWPRPDDNIDNHSVEKWANPLSMCNIVSHRYFF